MATMAPLQKMFHTILAAEATVTAVVSADKIEPDRTSEDNKPPVIRIEVLDDNPISDLGEDSGTGQARVQVACIGYSRKVATDIANVVRPALADYRGTVNDVAIQALTFDGVNRNYEPPYDDGDEKPWFYEALVFYVFYGPGGPT